MSKEKLKSFYTCCLQCFGASILLMKHGAVQKERALSKPSRIFWFFISIRMILVINMITYNLVKYKHRYNNDPAPFTNKKPCLGGHCKIGRMNLSLETTISSFPRFAGGTVQTSRVSFVTSYVSWKVHKLMVQCESAANAIGLGWKMTIWKPRR